VGAEPGQVLVDGGTGACRHTGDTSEVPETGLGCDVG
jgi:hypothetical protein